ncbi:hypothetical protein LQ948_15300 [Jiella sp. MQZ9-1]|uniref:Uncharacterized protein n=1 Tax=Jiella flava TaxID=2816857 RepID=A0A939G197_9HYPH|nr:hypothetical protein [Jiella flava]MBO0664000.1 hypothetical protein [Jiella flava]MCD2472571.1 hypothetical protein [Jiella flava]
MTKLKEESARQGRRGTPVLIVLVVALALCAIALIGFEVFGNDDVAPSLDASGTTTTTTTETTAPQTGTATQDNTVVAPGGDNGANGAAGTESGTAQ